MGMPSWRAVLEAVAKAWEERRDEIRGRRRPDRRAPAAAARCCEPSEEPLSTRRLLDAAVGDACARTTTPRNGGFGGAPKFPPASALEFLLRRGETEHDRPDAARDGVRRDVRPGRRRLRALLGRPLLARPPLREDALRQRAARARVPARLAGHRRAAVPARRRGDARLGAARDARPPRAASTPRSTPTRRARRASSTSGPCEELREALAGEPDADEAIAWFGATDRGNFEGRQHPGARPGRAGAARRLARAALRGARAARLAGPRRQAPHLLERADDLRAGRGRRRARARRLPGRRRAPPPSSCWATLRDDERPPAAHLEGRPGQAERLPRGPRLPARGAAHAVRGDASSRAGSPRRARSPTR